MWNIGIMGGKGQVCKELRKRMIDLCCLQVRTIRQGSRILGIEG